MAKIYYIGWAIELGPVYAESPFNYDCKGVDIFNYGQCLMNAFQSSGEHQVKSVPIWIFYKLVPGEYGKILEEFPPILGYNQSKEREDFDTILRIKETGDPLLVFGEVGQGNVLAYT
ncbi:MAG: glutamine amidotransferase [Bacteroidota bacterium]